MGRSCFIHGNRDKVNSLQRVNHCATKAEMYKEEEKERKEGRGVQELFLSLLTAFQFLASLTLKTANFEFFCILLLMLNQ